MSLNLRCHLKFIKLRKPEHGDESPVEATAQDLARLEQSIEKAKQKQRVADSYQPNWGSDDKRQAETERINRHQRGIPEPDSWDW